MTRCAAQAAAAPAGDQASGAQLLLSPAALYARLEHTESLLTTERQEKARLSTYLTQVFKEVWRLRAALVMRVRLLRYRLACAD